MDEMIGPPPGHQTRRRTANQRTYSGGTYRPSPRHRHRRRIDVGAGLVILGGILMLIAISGGLALALYAHTR